MTVEQAELPKLSEAAEALYAPLIQRAMAEAAQFDAVDMEITLLRLWLKEAVQEDKRDYAVILKGFAQIIRAVSVKYKLSPKSQHDLASAFAALVERLDDAVARANEEDDL